MMAILGVGRRALHFNQSIWYFKYLIEQFNETCWTARSGVANQRDEFSNAWCDRRQI